MDVGRTAIRARTNGEIHYFAFNFQFPIKPFTGDFNLPKRICLNGLFLFFFDKVRHFLSKFSTLVTSQKKVFFALSEASKSVFGK
jgi:hypothetical protein